MDPLTIGVLSASVIAGLGGASAGPVTRSVQARTSSARKPALRARNETAQAAGEAVPSFEITVDHVATVMMGLATIGLVVAGLGNRRVVVAATDEVERAGNAAQVYVLRYGTPEVKRNFDTLNTHRFGDGTYRMCVALDDRRLAYCMFVDGRQKPPSVKPDPDKNPNGKYFRNEP